MKKESINKLIIVLMILLSAEIIAYGTIKSINRSKLVSESYQTEITMAKTVVLDGQSVISKYGKSISLESGMKGEIKDVIDWYGEKHNYQHIRAEFVLSNGDTLYVILNNDIECLDNTITPVIDINNIENSQIVISEFNQTHDLYNYKVKQTIITGCIISTIIAVIIVSIVIIFKSFIHFASAEKMLIIFSACVDTVMLIAILFESYVSGWY